MKRKNSQIVHIRRQWNDWKIGGVELMKIENLHWDTISGGVHAASPQPFIHGYVWCNDIIKGEIAHSCEHGTGPHNIKVCIVKKDNSPEIFKKLLEITGPKPKYKRGSGKYVKVR
ncbi:hypothetical protein HQ544_01585 [Candidatus Falkowbacteria bacterium]|nr:hypothetical protein [Candidatus Falkowbacteria bacterium]